MVWIGTDHRGHLVPTALPWQQHCPLDQVSQTSIQPGLEHFPGWGINNLSRQPCPVLHHSQSKEFLPNSPFKSTLLELKAIFLWTVTFDDAAKPSPALLKGPFRYWKAAVRSCWSLFFYRLNTNSLCLSLHKRCYRPWIILVALLRTPWKNEYSK